MMRTERFHTAALIARVFAMMLTFEIHHLILHGSRVAEQEGEESSDPQYEKNGENSPNQHSR